MLDLVQTVSVIGVVRSLSGWSDPGTIMSIISTTGAIVVGVLLYRAYRKTNKLSEDFHKWTRGLKHPTPVIVTGSIERTPPAIDPLKLFLRISNPGEGSIFLLAPAVRMHWTGESSDGDVLKWGVRDSRDGGEIPRKEISGGTGGEIHLDIANSNHGIEAGKLFGVEISLTFVSGTEMQTIKYPMYSIMWIDEVFSEGLLMHESTADRLIELHK